MSRILINDGNDSMLLGRVILAESAFERMKGLLGRSALPEGTGLLIRPCGGIHMWFMRFPIDAAFLDRELRVLKVARNLRPWRLAFAPKGTACVLEAAAGALAPVRESSQLLLRD